MARFRGFSPFLFLLFIFVAFNLGGADKCGDEISGLASNCRPVLQGNPPSAACCGLIRTADLSCVCSKVTPTIAAQINVPKMVSVVQSCGRNIPHHTRCGSIVTP